MRNILLIAFWVLLVIGAFALHWVLGVAAIVFSVLVHISEAEKDSNSIKSRMAAAAEIARVALKEDNMRKTSETDARGEKGR